LKTTAQATNWRIKTVPDVNGCSADCLPASLGRVFKISLAAQLPALCFERRQTIRRERLTNPTKSSATSFPTRTPPERSRNDRKAESFSIP